jgi:hypothetical protein
MIIAWVQQKLMLAQELNKFSGLNVINCALCRVDTRVFPVELDQEK